MLKLAAEGSTTDDEHKEIELVRQELQLSKMESEQLSFSSKKYETMANKLKHKNQGLHRSLDELKQQN